MMWNGQGDWPEDPGGLGDSFAGPQGGSGFMVTLDKDFGELAIVRNIPHSGIIRLVNISARKQADICIYVLEQYSDTVKRGAIITVEENRVRIKAR